VWEKSEIVRLGRCKFGSVLDGSHIFVRIMDFCFLIWLEESVKNMHSRYSSIAPQFVPYPFVQECGVVLNIAKLKRKFHIPLLVMKTFIEACKKYHLKWANQSDPLKKNIEERTHNAPHWDVPTINKYGWLTTYL